MNFLKHQNVGGLAFSVWPALVGAMAANGCSSTPAPPPDAVGAGDVGPGTNSGVNDAPACGQGDLTWQLGNPVTPQPHTYADGSAQDGSPVHVNCKVDQSGGGFDIQLAAELDGMNGGTLFISGTGVRATGSTSGLTGTFTTSGQNFIDHNCTFTQTYNGGNLPAGGQPAQGRIWGHIDCPNAVANGMFGISGDGGSVARTCDGRADFFFENCN
jgi:hypothetical protein